MRDHVTYNSPYKYWPAENGQSRKQIIVSTILSNNEPWGNFQYIELFQRWFFGRIEDTINCFRVTSSDGHGQISIPFRKICEIINCTNEQKSSKFVVIWQVFLGFFMRALFFDDI